MNLKPLIYDLTYQALENQLSAMGEPGFRARQIWVALYQNHKVAPDDISTLPKALRIKLAEEFSFTALSAIREVESQNGFTIKTLFKLRDGPFIEAVLMIYNDRNTLCISSQSGCGLGCSFCATGQMGLSRNLSSGEIVAQVLYYARSLAERDAHITNVVLMGMGEPFMNYEAVMEAIERINDPNGFGLGARRITISTIGVVPKIKQFADAAMQINLAVSLHTVDDDLRSQLMPINKKYPVQSLLDACRYYTQKTNRRISFEYALINGVNDSELAATELAQKIHPMLCHVNLIPLNPIQGFDQVGSDPDRVKAFSEVLESFKIPCTIRLRRGIEIGAGCGQLAAEGGGA